MKIIARAFKYVAVFIALFFAAQSTMAQDISFADRTVTIDGKACMKISGNPNNVVFSNMNDEELIILKFMRPKGELYTKVMFVKEHKYLTSRSYIFTKKNLIKNLVSSGVIKDCELLHEKMLVFIMKFDEDINED